jgi:hypothetical protein
VSAWIQFQWLAKVFLLSKGDVGCLKMEFEVSVYCSDASAYSGVKIIWRIGVGVERERERERERSEREI